MTRAELVVTGASSQVGYCLLGRAVPSFKRVTAIARRRPGWAREEDPRWLRHDLATGWPEGLLAPLLVHAAPLDLLPPLVPGAASAGLRRLVAFGSTSMLVKDGSADPAEREMASRLAGAEAALAEACAASGVAWTVLRPTLIYGLGLDRNLSAMAGLARRLRFLPLPGGGCGLRQPVHADDLAGAALAALDNPAAPGRAFELAGGTTLSYRDMAAGLFRAQGMKPRFLPLPAGACRAAIRLLRLLPAYRELHPALVARIGRDLVFDDTEARRVLGWDPRPFDAGDAVRPPPGHGTG